MGRRWKRRRRRTFWEIVLEQLQLFQSEGETDSNEHTGEFSGSASAVGSAIFLKGTGKVGGRATASTGRSNSRNRAVSSRVAALAGLRSSRSPLVIDDFHYLPKKLQAELVRALKPLIFDGLAVVVIAIPHRRYDAIRVEKEMTGRVLSMEIPTWNVTELSFIPLTGMDLLDRNLQPNLLTDLADQAIGSPHLTQEFCRGICRKKSKDGLTLPEAMRVSKQDLETVFRETANSIGRPIFEKLARGPRQRTDRIPRSLQDGSKVDIYGLILHALAHLKPGLVTLEYEDLRSAIREVSAQDIPQLQEVARVLKHMSDIAASDESSSPVIDFEEDTKLLHITDPFFAFYLRWGRLER